MGKIKVLIVDDSAVIRKVLGDLLREDPEIEVVGTAANGKIALAQLAELKPDVVTLDVEMPEMNGLETVKAMRDGGATQPIIMCSSLTAHGASTTLDALALGASDYVTKPSSHGVNTREVVGEDLLRKIKGLASTRAPDARPATGTPAALWGSAPVPVAAAAFDAIAIGVSTGGPNALMEIFPKIPCDLPVPIFLVQHMPPLFTKMLAERLTEVSKIKVFEAHNGQDVVPGCAYLAPGGFHMEVKRVIGRTSIVLNENPPENSCRPAVDVLFRSVAAVYGAKALAAVLTGMCQDGLLGCQAIRAKGGTIVAQDKDSSAVWGMPGAVVEAGIASAVLPLGQVADALSGAVKRAENRAEARA